MRYSTDYNKRLIWQGLSGNLELPKLSVSHKSLMNRCPATNTRDKNANQMIITSFTWAKGEELV